MSQEKSQIVLTDETREIVASYLSKRQKIKREVDKKRAELVYDVKRPKKG